MNESSAESVDRQNEIQQRIKKRKLRRDQKRIRREQRQSQNLKQSVLHLTEDDVNPHELYDTPIQPLPREPIEIIYDSGASITMLPADFHESWTNLRPSLHTISGCFAAEGTHSDILIGEFHGILQLDNGETIRLIIPEAVALPPSTSKTYLLCDTQFLMAGNKYISDLRKPVLQFKQGGRYTMNVKTAHKIITLYPAQASSKTNHRRIFAHLPQQYDPPTFINNATTRRPNAKTPTAFIHHLRWACACQEVLYRTQQNVIGFNVQHNSWKDLATLLPCSSCIAGKMRKSKKATPHTYTDVTALYTHFHIHNPTLHKNLAVSRTPATASQNNARNKEVSLDWAIINKTNKPDEPNVLAVFLDVNIGFVYSKPQLSRGQAGEALESYNQEIGIPTTIRTDNAEEFIAGKFANLCKEKGIKQVFSAPYTPNQNPVEKYMDILVSGARSLLFTSGLPHTTFWQYAIEHRTYLQNRMALPGRCTPFDLMTGRQPNVTNLRIFGCETMAYIEKDKRNKFDAKAERCIYLGASTQHSDDTYRLWNIATSKVIIRRNVVFNEKIFPGRKMKFSTTTKRQDTGADLLGLTFYDDNILWTIKSTGNFNGHPVLHYEDTATGNKEFSSVAEVRQWYNKTILTQNVNSVTPTRNSYINDIAFEAYKTIKKTYDVKLRDKNVKAPTSYNKAGNRESPWFEAENKEKHGILQFQTWKRIPQHSITTEIRKKALRAHHMYTVKRGDIAKDRVVVNGNKQHPDTYSDTTSPVASQLQVRLHLAICAFRLYHTVQMDLTNF